MENTNNQVGDMMAVSSHCSRFTRRHELNMFNMMDYQSCENCRHQDEEGGCIVKGRREDT